MRKATAGRRGSKRAHESWTSGSEEGRTEFGELEVLEAEVVEDLALLVELEEGRAGEGKVELGCRGSDEVGNVERVALSGERGLRPPCEGASRGGEQR